MSVCSALAVLVRTAGLCTALASLVFAGSSSVKLQNIGNEKISIAIDGQPYADFYIGTKYPKPFLEPLRTAHGYVVTRRWPTTGNGEGESHDHQHHRGLWIGYGSISGINFWENEYDYRPPNRGTIVLEKLDRVQSGGAEGVIAAHFLWKDPGGAPMIREARTTVVRANGAVRMVDVDSSLTAARDIHFDDTKEGFFALRLADSLAGKNGGLLTNSQGAKGEKAVWGKRADWVVDSGSISTADGPKAVQVIILDHPANPNHPPRWHARDYGLFAINPFGLKDFEPQASETGGRTVASGESLRFRYRVILAEGAVNTEQIARWYAEFSAP